MASHSEDRTLARGTLRLPSLVMVGLAAIAPGFSMAFTVNLMAGTVGAAVPLTYLICSIAVLTTANALAQFSTIWPSSGSFVTFVARALGPRRALLTAVVALTGYLLGWFGVFLFAGQYISQNVLGVEGTGWTLLFDAVYGFLLIGLPVILGLRVGLGITIAFYIFEIVVLLLVTIAILVQGGDHGLTAAPFDPSNTSLSALGLAFPLAIFAFIGFEAPVPLAEESVNPARNVRRAVMTSVAVSGALYVLISYAIVVAFETPGALANSTNPFGEAADRYLSAIPSALITVMVIVSMIASSTAMVAQVSRVVYNGAREGLWSTQLGRLHARFRTPYAAVLFLVGVSVVLGIASTRIMDIGLAIGFFGTWGALGAIFMYAMTNVALIMLWRARRREGQHGSVWSWVGVPVLGVASLLLPLWGTIKPGQDYPYNWMWLCGIVLIALGAIYTRWVIHRRPSLIHTAGAIVVGEEAAPGAADGRGPLAPEPVGT